MCKYYYIPEYSVSMDKPNECAADQKTSDTGVYYADIHVEESDRPLPRVSDDKKVIYSKPLFEKMDYPPDSLLEPAKQNENKFDDQDFDKEDIQVFFYKPCEDSDEEEPPPIPPRNEVRSAVF